MNYKNIYKYLEVLKQRPGMYIGSNNIDDLFKHLAGYDSFIWFNNIGMKEIPRFDIFHDYIAMLYGYNNKNGAGWSTILHKEYGDGKEALDKFFVHLDEFKKEFEGKSDEEIIKYFADKGYNVRGRFNLKNQKKLEKL